MGRCNIKKLDNVRVAIENLPDEKSAPIGHQFEWCHFILDIKMENFRQIALSLFCLESPIIATLNDLEVLDDIFNPHIQTPVAEKVWTTLGPELGNYDKNTAVIVRAIYGLKPEGLLLEACGS